MNEAVVELLPIDITPYRQGNGAVEYVHRFDSGIAGPEVMVNALTHGNELCGAHALEFLFKNEVRPIRGALILSFANVAAYHSFDSRRPGLSRFVDEDFNRLWTDAVLDSDRDSAELRRARELRPVVDTADYLLDIHSMQLVSPPLMLSGTAQKGWDLALRVGVPENVVADAGHMAGARMRDYRGFAEAVDPRTALLVECGQHWSRQSADVAVETTVRFLDALGVIDPAFAAAHVRASPPKPRLIEVSGPITISSSDFAFVEYYQGLEVIPKAGTIIGYDGVAPITTPYDDCVLIMPSRRLQQGQTAVRLGRYVA